MGYRFRMPRGLQSTFVVVAMLLSIACQAAPAPSPTSAPTAAKAPAATAPAATAPAAKAPVATAPAAKAPAATTVPGTAKAPTAAPKKIKIATVTPLPVVLPLYYAQEKGLFLKYGLDPEIQVVSSTSNPIAALTSGEVQILLIAAEGLDANLQGVGVVYIMSFLPASPFVLYTKPEITDPSQLRGKKIAVASVNSSTENLAKFVLDKAGIPVSDVDLVYTGDSATNSLAALTSGQIDAAVLASPTTFAAKNAGFRDLVVGANVGWEYFANSNWVAKSYAAENRDVVLSYTKAIIEAIASIKKDRAGAMDVIAKTNNIKDPETARRTYDEYYQAYLKVPLPSLNAVRAALKDRSKSNPAAADADPARFGDERFVRELESSGFIKQLYGE